MLLLTLGIHNSRLSKQQIEILCNGLSENSTLLELTLNKSTFDGFAGAYALGEGLKRCTSVKHLGFQKCGLSDTEVALIVQNLTTHPSLLELSLDGNHCMSKGLDALAAVLDSSTSNLVVLDLASQNLPKNETMDFTRFGLALGRSNKLACLQLSDNELSQESSRALSEALKRNTSLRVLHLAWCTMSEESLGLISDGLCYNSTLVKLVLYDCNITDHGIRSFSARLPYMTGLKRLDLGGQQRFGMDGTAALVQGLDANMELEEVNVCRKANKRAVEFLMMYTDLNRGGRRFLRHPNAPAALWSNILENAQTVDLPSTIDFVESENGRQQRLVQPVNSYLTRNGFEPTVGLGGLAGRFLPHLR